jgi:protein SCO1/2
MKKKHVIWIFIAMVFLVPLMAYAAFIFYEHSFQSLPVYGKSRMVNDKRVDHAIPAFELINQDGNTTTLSPLNNKIVIVDFFFTHCPTVCPRMTKSLLKVQRSFNPGEILIRSISVDPGRDNPAQLSRYAQKNGINTTNWDLLTGDKKVIYRLARNDFMIVATDGDGGDNDFIHSEKLVLIDKQQRIRGYYNGTSGKEVNDLIRDIKKLNHEK